ncbi:hypothetical protein ASF88_00010 [Leifsonia sp. Leaf336]|uniref:hypothetical protein n=1 Tax=Leifsonia sp. Leaf336 TaxID=1736341 RepID=UPI0006F25404|nr:hypothetical protein [Leifsonia sp. Leaf336]KQR53328.1 hypothetical protein ASF88_00010 [Leifsonia sp. Leaf336]
MGERFHAVGRDRESSLGERMQAGDSSVQHELEARRDLLVGRDRESSLGERMQAGDSSVQHELEARRDLLVKVDRYVEVTSEELEQTRSRVRQSFDDELELLAKERNALPWE